MRHPVDISRFGAAILGAALLAPLPANAQEATGAVRLGLDSLEAAGAACRITLVAENALGTPIGKLAYEFVFFDKDGRVDLLTVLDLKDLPTGRMRVRQFDLPGLDCGGISRVLVNDVKACQADGVEPAACLDRLETSSKAGIPLES